MNFWHMQLLNNENRKNIHTGFSEKVLKEKKVIGLADWEEGEEVIRQFNDEMEIGDIVAIKEGKEPVALVKVSSDSYEDNVPNAELDWFPIRRRIEIIDIYKDYYSFSIPTPRGTLSICRDKKSETYKTIIKWYNNNMDNNSNKEVIDLLLYKRQIILQGPPGTGKTRMAKLVAEEMTRSKIKISPLEFIEKYIVNYKENSESLKNKSDTDNLVSEFKEIFPANELNKLNLNTYCQGSGSQNSFCYWLEKNLKQLGQFGPGKAGARVYFVYFSKEENKYFTKNGGDPNEVMKSVAQIIYKLVNDLEIDSAKKYFRKTLILKILNSYYPDKYFPVYNKEHIINIGKLFEIETNNLDEIEINKKINDKFYGIKNKYNSSITNFEIMGVLYDKFKIKDGLSSDNDIESVEYLGDYKIIQFHPSYSYEDFVRGISAVTNEKNEIEYKVENRIISEFALQALKDKSNNYILIIDEINRANLPSVLGELIYALEYRFDEKKPKETIVRSMYAYKTNPDDLDGDYELRIPDNLYIVGTMNTADRSVGHIDYAIRRRFAFVEMLPSESVIDEVIKDELLKNKAKKLFNDVGNLFTINYLAPDFKPCQVQLGHSYFLAETDEELKLKLEYEIKPILEEYLKDGILLDSAKKEIENIKL